MHVSINKFYFGASHSYSTDSAKDPFTVYLIYHIPLYLFSIFPEPAYFCVCNFSVI
jgi:hypothetical protein